jgi:hypothetical protein
MKKTNAFHLADWPARGRLGRFDCLRRDPEALGKRVGLGLALIGHVAKLPGDLWFAAGCYLPKFGHRHPQKDDRLADRID